MSFITLVICALIKKFTCNYRNIIVEFHYGIILDVFRYVRFVMIFVKSALTDSDIVQFVRLKGRAGAEALYDRYAIALLVAIIRIVPQKKISEDTLEKTFIKIWNTFDFYLPEKERLFTWMIMIARDTAKEAKRAELD